MACQDPFIYGPPLLAVVSCSWDALEIGYCLAWQRALKWLLLGENFGRWRLWEVGASWMGLSILLMNLATAARPGVSSLWIGAQYYGPLFLQPASLGLSSLVLIFIPKQERHGQVWIGGDEGKQMERSHQRSSACSLWSFYPLTYCFSPDRAEHRHRHPQRSL